MNLTRRGFAAGALSASVALQLPARALAERPAELVPAMAAIGAYAEAHMRRFGLPGMTLGLSMPDGFSQVLNFGFANRDTRQPIGDNTLFQIGSISKVMAAALLHQFAAEGRLALPDRVSAILPNIPLPTDNTITVQHLLDHVAGLAADAPTFPNGGLWTAYRPGEHWHYSNTGYDILGKIAEQVGGKPLDRLLEDRIFTPLGMRRTRGAIIAADRLRYAQGYEAADPTIPFARGAPLAPAAWVDMVSAGGCAASTADDMNRFMRTLANAAQGRGGLGLDSQHGRALTSHFVASDTPGMSYGNGLMRVGGGGRSYLHHTGGMVSFSSSFHLDVASGVGAFASTTVGAFLEYRPRLLTSFAVDALTNAASGRPAPTPPSLIVPLPNPASYVGRYSGPAGAFQVAPGEPLALIAEGGEPAALQPWGGYSFRTTHPRFKRYALKFERTGGAISAVSWGPNTFVREGSGAAQPASDPALAKFAGRYINDSPWIGAARVVERGGRLWLGTETPLVPIGDNLWRLGPESWSPERATFADFIEGRPQTFIFSGEKFLRHDV
jgi:CubicO group peptidase (beta-lactamase class C family)